MNHIEHTRTSHIFNTRIDFIKPRTIDKNIKFKLPVVIDVNGKNVEMLGGEESVPYKELSNGMLEKVYNTKVPYGNVSHW